MKQNKIAISLIMVVMAFAQFTIKGKVTDAKTGEALVGANVILKGTTIGASTDAAGVYKINVDGGNLKFEFSYLGYKTFVKDILVKGSQELDIKLEEAVMKSSEVVIAASRAKKRESSVSFSDVSKAKVTAKGAVADVPNALKAVPGVFVTSDAGSGMGDTQISIRGFDAERVQVMINGIPVNDPESGKVYWSNWTALSSTTSSVQVQRGAGEATVGSGAMGGSVNVLTSDLPQDKNIEYSSTIGSYGTYKNTFSYNSGLLDNNWAFSALYGYTKGKGFKKSSHYVGQEYSVTLAKYFDKHSFKFNLYGAPQEHASVYYASPKEYYEKYGRDWTETAYIINNDGEEESLSNNHYHKPQIELHHSFQMDKNTFLKSTAFMSIGMGGGESINDQHRLKNDYDGDIHLNANGSVNMASASAESWFYQLDRFSEHMQVGLSTTYSTKFENHSIKTNIAGRHWIGDHYGVLNDTFGKDTVDIYVGYANNFAGSTGFVQGDRYYDYTGIVDVVDMSVSDSYKLNRDFTINASIQYSFKNIATVENGIPGNNNFTGRDGVTGKLVDDAVTYNLFSPKLGFNYNLSKEFNVYSSYAHVEKAPRNKHIYNYGGYRDDLKKEESEQIEIGAGYATPIISANFSYYRNIFSNKVYTLQDYDKRNQPGYDHKGRYSVIGGEDLFSGVEGSIKFKPFSFLEMELVGSMMDNEHQKDILDASGTDTLFMAGLSVTGTPQKQLSGSITYLKDGLSITLLGNAFDDYFFYGSNVDDKRTKLTEYSTFDVDARYTYEMDSMIKGVTVGVQVKNIFDTEYWQSAGKYGYMVGAPRNYLGTITFNF
jgi:outer membrane receptor protein involved in Fe transport